MASKHKYAKGIGFYFHSEEKFDKLLDQVKVISQEDYDREAQDGFEDLVKYWNDKSFRDFERKLESNARNIKFMK